MRSNYEDKKREKSFDPYIMWNEEETWEKGFAELCEVERIKKFLEKELEN